MSVHVHTAGEDEQPRRVMHLGVSVDFFADSDDPAARDENVGAVVVERRYNPAIANEKFAHRLPLTFAASRREARREASLLQRAVLQFARHALTGDPIELVRQHRFQQHTIFVGLCIIEVNKRGVKGTAKERYLWPRRGAVFRKGGLSISDKWLMIMSSAHHVERAESSPQVIRSASEVI